MHPFDRREFLRLSAALSAAAAVNGTARAAEKTASAKAGEAADRLRVAVVGVKGRGMNHVGGFLGKNNCVITHVCDCDEAVIGNAMKQIEGKQGKAPAFEKDFRRLVEDKTIDVVSIATPNHWHALMAIWAMQAGKHVYVEKPASHNVSEGRRMVEAARKYNRVCQTGTQSRSNPGMRDAVAHVLGGKIGKVTLAYGTCYKRRNSIGQTKGETPVPKTCDYDLWCGPAPKKPLTRQKLHYDWHWVWDTGNGDLGNQGSHEMDKARWGLGKTELPKSAVSLGGRFGYADDGETPNTQLCVFDYGDSELIFEVRGLASTNPYPGGVEAKKKAGENFVGNIFFGSDGTVVCPSYGTGIVLDPSGAVVKQFNGGNDQHHFDNFVKAVRSGKREDLNCDVLEGHLSAALCHLANVSYRLGREATLESAKDFTDDKAALQAFAKMAEHLRANGVSPAEAKGRVGVRLEVDPKTETFTNNKEANVMLTREYRKGFEVPESV